MANTFSQIYLHLVFSVKERARLISNDWKDDLYSYIGAIIKNQQQHPIIINGMEAHIHTLLSVKPTVSISNLLREIKTASSKFCNEKRLNAYKFAWQDGYAVFSCSESQLDKCYQYIKNQEIHHRKITFEDEYKQLLIKNNIKFEDKYLF